jgi:two-component system, cell cycle sensor histidine kinase and response regulator CckA
LENEVWPVKTDATQVDQILTNLCVSAWDSIVDTGKVIIETGNTVIDEDYCRVHAGFVHGEYAILGMSDNGCAIDEETQSHIFKSFFNTKEMGKGTGLSLAKVYKK